MLFPEELRGSSLEEEDLSAAPLVPDDESELLAPAVDVPDDDAPLPVRLPDDPPFWDWDELFDVPLSPLEDFVPFESEVDEGAGAEAGAAAAGSGVLAESDAGEDCEELDPELEPLPASTFTRPSSPPTVTLSAPAVPAPTK